MRHGVTLLILQASKHRETIKARRRRTVLERQAVRERKHQNVMTNFNFTSTERKTFTFPDNSLRNLSLNPAYKRLQAKLIIPVIWLNARRSKRSGFRKDRLNLSLILCMQGVVTKRVASGPILASKTAHQKASQRSSRKRVLLSSKRRRKLTF